MGAVVSDFFYYESKFNFVSGGGGREGEARRDSFLQRIQI